jgi:hypothetical protein
VLIVSGGCLLLLAFAVALWVYNRPWFAIKVMIIDLALFCLLMGASAKLTLIMTAIVFAWLALLHLLTNRSS